MPVMDGFEATRRIRELYPDLPVVALSAAVMETDRQRARQSGMLGHLAKPIDENELYRTLGDWLESSDAPGTASNIACDTGLGLPTLEGFDLARGLRSADGDAAFYHRLLNHFKNQLKGEFAFIVDCLEQAGDASAPRMIHSLKAIADTVGHTRLAGIATSIDRAFKKGRKITAAMRSELRAAMNEAQFQLESLPALAGTAREITPEEGRAAVTKLLGVLRNNELVDDSLLAKVTDFLDRRLGARTSDDFRIQVERFEHDAAADMLVAMAARCGEELP
jgi:two-component system, sensor histidine kinase and response regulator